MNSLEEMQALIAVGETFTEKPKEVTVNVRAGNWMERVLLKIGLMKPTRVFEISPILVGNRFRISPVASRIPDDIWTDGKLDLKKSWQAIQDHTDDYIYVVAVCIQNNKNEPSKVLLDYLRWIDDKEFLKLLDMSLTMAGIGTFMKSTLLIKGANVLSVPGRDAQSVTEPE